jgi:hypothetical protein
MWHKIFGGMTLSLKTLGIMTLSITDLIAALSIINNRQNHSVALCCHIFLLYAECQYADCHYIECHIFLLFAECCYTDCHHAEYHLLNAIMLSAIMLSAIMLSAIMLSASML